MPRTPKKPKPAATTETPARPRTRRPSLEEIARRELAALELESMAEAEEAEIFPTVLPLLPIRDQVYFPHMIFPLLVGREKSVRALEEAAAGNRHIFIVAQQNLQAEDPDPEDIYNIGI